MRRKSALCVLVVLLHACVCLIRGHVLIDIAPGEPHPDSKQVIESFHVQTDIRYRFATTKMSSVVRNTAGIAHEMTFDVTLPKEAFIISFAMTIDGKVYDGEVKEKQAAKDQYTQAVNRGQSAGFIRQTPRHSNRFDMSVNVANGTAVNFTLVYQQILARKLGVYEYEMHVEPGQAVEDFNVEVFIQENRPLLFVKTPRLRKASTVSNKIEASEDLTIVDRPTANTAHIQYKPTIVQQGKSGLAARFVVQYDVEHSANGDVLVADGYFIHLFSPKPRSPLPKDIVFVLDVSGSMRGTKIAQQKDAMKAILEDLTEDDRFNILTFSDQVTSWKPTFARVTTKVVREANNFVDTMRAEGGTDINQAVTTALHKLQMREEKVSVGMIFFLTDGEATSGETNPIAIARNIQNKNDNQISIYSLAFGEGANFESLKTISTQNFGYARKIYEASDAALQVESLYDEISTVAMKNVTVKYLPSITKTTETVFPIVHNGTEIMVCGTIDLKIPGEGSSIKDSSVFRAEIEGQEKTGNVDILLEIDDIEEITIDPEDSLNSFFTMPRDFAGIVEKMWAFMSIKQTLKEKQGLIEEADKVKDLDKKILEMSLKYNFVTPLTSMVVTKPDTDSPVESGLEDADESMRPPVMPHRGYSYMARGNPGSRNPSMMSRTAQNLLPALPSLDLSPHFSHHGHSDPSLPSSSRANKAKASYRSKGKRKNRSKGKRRKATMGILKSIVFRTDKSSMCLAPKRIPIGKYLLAAVDGNGNSSKGFNAELTTGCLRKCRIVVPEYLILTSSKKTTQVNLLSLDTWSLNQHPDFDYVFGTNEITMIHNDVSIKIMRTQKHKRMFFSIELDLSNKENATSSGMTELMKKTKTRKQRRTPKVCGNSKADVSMYLAKRKILNYKV